jgi:hypothetical protein
VTRPQFQRRTHRAREALDSWGARHQDIWRLVDDVRRDRRDEWPPYIFLPLEDAGEIMGRYSVARGARFGSPADLVRPASLLALFAAWRVTQGIYRYDPALYEAIVATPIVGDIPGELLRRLPEWCVYVETPDMTAPLIGGGDTQLHGVWAWLDRPRVDDYDVLTLGLDTHDAGIAIGHVPLIGTLDESLTRVEEEWRSAVVRGNASSLPPASYAAAARGTFGPILSLLLYLCSEASEIGDGASRPANPQPTRTKRGWRLFAADRPTTWDVGVRMGAALRRAYQAEETGADPVPTGRHVRPHVRRAHWHTFLAGSGRSERRVKWLPPIAVNLEDPSQLAATVRRV